MSSCSPDCTLSGPNYQIDADQGKFDSSNKNLFHSFSEFNLTSGESASFNSSIPVNNIISRVTGGNVSNINGTIRSSVEGANIWLINPAGLVFGENAKLDISGSFHASTADYLRLGKDGKFAANLKEPDNFILSSSAPSAFGFLDSDIAPIQVQSSQLRVAPGKALSLIGGNIEITGYGKNTADIDLNSDPVNLQASSGRINLVSVASQSEIDLAAPDANTTNIQLGEISLNDGATLSTRGDPAGTIYIRAGRFVMENSVLDASSTGNNAHTSKAIDIKVSGEMKLTSGITSASNTYGGSYINASSEGQGNAGEINIVAQSLLLEGGKLTSVSKDWNQSGITSYALSMGNSADIDIRTENLTLNNGAMILSETMADGNSGNINITTQGLFIYGVEQSSLISTSTSGRGDAGDIDIHAELIISRGGSGDSTGITSQVSSEASGGNSGSININVKDLEIYDGAQFSASIFSGNGLGGDVNVKADSIQIAGTDAMGYSAGIFSIMSGYLTSGQGGNVNIETQKLTMTDVAMVGVWGNAYTIGNSGKISILAKDIEVSNGAVISGSAFGMGRGGDIFIKADTIRLIGPSPEEEFTGVFAVAALQGGDAGDINIETGNLEILDGAQVNNQTSGTGRGGSIDIKAGRIYVAGYDPVTDSISRISASTEVYQEFGAYSGGTGGNINIEADEIELRDQGLITTRSSTVGNGGDLEILVGKLSLEGNAEISANSTSIGKAGNLLIHAKSNVSLDSSRITSESVMSEGGNINLNAEQGLYLTNSEINAAVFGGEGSGGTIDIKSTDIVLNRSIISASNMGMGNAGDINLVSSGTLELFGSDISTEAGQADGGNINIYIANYAFLDHSSITAAVSGLTGNGGNIMIEPDILILRSSQIKADAHGGDGGNVSITANNLIATPDSSVSASSKLGLDGKILINAPSRDLDSEVSVLPESMLDASSLFRNDCAAIGGQFSSFIIHSHTQLTSPVFTPSYYIDEEALSLSSWDGVSMPEFSGLKNSESVDSEAKKTPCHQS
ncbi:MAG: filamentous hemagglutinin N-terminal domain-containing protein [Gammaproteobacteria bacterium]|nr:filamentous hemagglutinin N-terminal domain-containing protein [Gammaproteobacteria bacterium]